jgi:hypothetical protein
MPNATTQTPLDFEEVELNLQRSLIECEELQIDIDLLEKENEKLKEQITSNNFDTFVERAGGYCPWVNEIEEQLEEKQITDKDILDKFIDYLEELCGCKGEGYQCVFECILEWKENEKLKEQIKKIVNE